jgi:hypothetical protein
MKFLLKYLYLYLKPTKMDKEEEQNRPLERITKYTISFVALSKTLNMELSTTNDLIGEFAMLFSKDVDYENKKISIQPLQQNTEGLRKNFIEFVNDHKRKDQKLNQLNTYFKSLEDGENFFLIVNHEVNSDMHLALSNHLTSIKEGVSYESVRQKMNDLFEEILYLYDVILFDKETKKSIGEIDKTKRICRFCGKKSPEVTFGSVAHAISEALGNKKIVLNEECDDCNNKFGSKVEIDLIEYLRFYCIFYGIKGKEKIPEIKPPDLKKGEGIVKDGEKNFGIKNNGDGVNLMYYHTDNTESTIGDEFPLNLNLRSDKEIIDQNLYKTLCKYALSMIGSEYLPLFTETIKWLNGTKEIERLPKVALLVTNQLYDKHPQMTLFIRKKVHDKLPFLVAQFNFTAFTFVFIIPFCSSDKKDFLNNSDYDFFWDTFKHYSRLIGWRFLNFSGNKKYKLKMKLTIDSRK